MLAQQLDVPTEAPPQYSAAPTLPTNLVGGASGFIYEGQRTNLQNALTIRRQGALYLRPYTAEGQIDSIQLLFHAHTYLQSILLDLPPQSQVHQTWSKFKWLTTNIIQELIFFFRTIPLRYDIISWNHVH